MYANDPGGSIGKEKEILAAWLAKKIEILANCQELWHHGHEIIYYTNSLGD